MYSVLSSRAPWDRISDTANHVAHFLSVNDGVLLWLSLDGGLPCSPSQTNASQSNPVIAGLASFVLKLGLCSHGR